MLIQKKNQRYKPPRSSRIEHYMDKLDLYAGLKLQYLHVPPQEQRVALSKQIITNIKHK